MDLSDYICSFDRAGGLKRTSKDQVVSDHVAKPFDLLCRSLALRIKNDPYLGQCSKVIL